MMDRLVFWIYRLVAFFVRPFPIESVVRAGRALGAAAYPFAGPYRRLVLRNLTIAFGAEKSPAERDQLAREHFATLFGNMLASLKTADLSPYEIRQLAEVRGLEHVTPILEKKRGVIYVISHLGNWELFSQLMPALFDCPLGTIFQKLGNPYLDAAVRESRARLGVKLFERKEGFQGAVKTLRDGGIVGVLVDQHAGDAGVWCPFFNRLASTSSLAATLALRSGAALVPAALYTREPGRWQKIIDPPIEPASRDASEITAQINRALEAQIRRQPADWFWVHNRWKTPKPKFLLATYKRGVFSHSAPTDHQSPITNHPPLQPFRILIRASNWLGDAIMSVPAVRAIKGGRPDAHVTILTPTKLADIWKSVADVDDVIAFDPEDSIFAVAKKIRDGFDAAVVLPNSFRTALEPWLAGIPRRVGYPGHRRAALLNQVFHEKKRSRSEAPRHQVHHYLALAEFIGALAPEDKPVISDRKIVNGKSTLEPPHHPPITDHHSHPPTLGLCPGAEYGPAKRWLPERFAEVMRTIHQRTRCEWKIFGVEKDREVSDRIRREAAVPCTDLVGKTSLAGLIAELRTCDALVTNDTGTMHLAAHLGVPVVAVFGSTEPALTGPLGEGHRVLRHHVECSPCFLRECPIDFRCMKAVTAEEVIAAIEATLPARGR